MKKIFVLSPMCVAVIFAAICLSGCRTPQQSNSGSVSHEPFGHTADGTPVELYTLKNAHGMEAKIMTYGGIVQSLMVPDKNGNIGDVVLGYDTLDGYLTNSPY